MDVVLPSEEAVGELFRRHYGDPHNHGFRVRVRKRFGYFTPEQWYQAVVDQFVSDGAKWIDVGGGRSIFPQNPQLSRELAVRCARLVAIDPSDNLDQNEFANERVKTTIEEYKTDQRFDIATMRMVAEHVERPDIVVRSLAQLVKSKGHVIVYTPNRWSVGSIAASVIPNRWHHKLTRLVSSSRKEENVFPTFYKMNTRKRLRALFEGADFKEVSFAYLDDCALFQRYRITCVVELSMWKVLHLLGITYPENNLLGIYQRQ